MEFINLSGCFRTLIIVPNLDNISFQVIVASDFTEIALAIKDSVGLDYY